MTEFTISQLVETAAAKGASDIHLVCGLSPKIRVDGSLTNAFEKPLSDADSRALASELCGDRFGELEATGEIDLALTVSGSRLRINIFRQQTHYSAALRILKDKIPDVYTLGLPPAVPALAELPRGLVIVTGETGSGKSTTLAALIDSVNHRDCKHIITLEDPIEYIYEPDKCVINQREIGTDTGSYGSGLRAILREDPDVILIGEMRDLETIEIALTSAETGHLVFGTLHTGSAADSIDRMVDVFPEARQRQIRMQLSMTLRAVISQQLLPKSGGGRVLASELMIVNAAIKNLIREGKTPQISNTLATSAQEGSITMDNCIIALYKNRTISSETALSACHDRDYVKKSLRL